MDSLLSNHHERTVRRARDTSSFIRIELSTNHAGVTGVSVLARLTVSHASCASAVLIQPMGISALIASVPGLAAHAAIAARNTFSVLEERSCVAFSANGNITVALNASSLVASLALTILKSKAKSALDTCVLIIAGKASNRADLAALVSAEEDTVASSDLASLAFSSAGTFVTEWIALLAFIFSGKEPAR